MATSTKATAKSDKVTKAVPAETKTAVSANGKVDSNSTASNRIKVLKTYKIYIGGQFPRTESGRYYPLTLSDGEVVNICLSSRKDFRNAVVKARDAQDSWAGRAALNRSQILYRIAEMLETRTAQFVEELIQQGSTKAAAKAEVELSVDRLIYYAGWCDKYNQVFSTVNPVSSSHFNFSSTEAMGVVAMIAPQKSGLLGLISVIAPVIAGGNTCVVLASRDLPLCSVTFAEVLNSSDVPGGVVNILTGETKELLSHFSTHMDVNALYICTSDDAQKKSAETNAALNVKRVRIEAEPNWSDAKQESPYRIMDYLEVKTTWHPIGI
jgi:acyl-CoA reductase-like NAD-dependent aldehyde dehydrogenase